MDANTAIVWIVLGALSGGSIVHLCRKIDVAVPWVSVICLAVAFHFWPIWYWTRYRPVRKAVESERDRQLRAENWAELERRRFEHEATRIKPFKPR